MGVVLERTHGPSHSWNMSRKNSHTRSESRNASAPAQLTVEALITNNDTFLPEVYAHVHSAHAASPSDISAALQCDRQTVHRNLERLLSAGLVDEESETRYSLVEPALPPTVVQSVAELGSSLRLDLCEFAVDQRTIVVDDARRTSEMSGANLRKTLNALSDDGYLAKRSSRQDEGLLIYRVTDRGARELAMLDDPSEYLGRDGSSVSHYANGIEETAFRTAYEIEDAYVISQREECTIAELLAETNKEEKSTRRRLTRLTERGLLDVTRREAQNLYRPTPRTRQMVTEIRSLEDERRLRTWTETAPPILRDTLPDWFFPEELFQALETELHDADSGLADQYISTWKQAGLVEGNRHRGFRFVREES